MPDDAFSELQNAAPTPPIASPTGESFVPPAPKIAFDLPTLARWHRILVVAFVLDIFAEIAFVLAQIDDYDRASWSQLGWFWLAALLLLGVAVLRAVSVFKVAQSLRMAAPILAALLSFFGVIGFLIFLNFNKRARAALRRNGVKVGFWGAKRVSVAHP